MSASPRSVMVITPEYSINAALAGSFSLILEESYWWRVPDTDLVTLFINTIYYQVPGNPLLGCTVYKFQKHQHPARLLLDLPSSSAPLKAQASFPAPDFDTTLTHVL